jgi:hypothetical protein
MTETKTEKEKREMWALGIDVWKEAACVTQPMQDAIGGLRDADGDPLPDVAKQFILDMLFLRTKPPGKTQKYLPKETIREQYHQRLFMEQRGRESPDYERQRGDPSASEAVMQGLADVFKTTVPVIDQIVHQRPSRKPSKTR